MRYFSSLLLLLTIFLSTNSVYSQETGTLRGLVSDSLSGEVLVYASAYIKEINKGAHTDTRGYFIIPSVPANKTYTVAVSYVGYQTKFITVEVDNNKLSHYNISLSAKGIQMQTIEKVGDRYEFQNDTKVSVQRIAARELELMPKGVETDVFRSIQYLPGVQTTGDVSAKYYVRGGAANQNLVLVDGVTVYNPFHALGLFGVIDPDIVNNLEFYKGGFAAEFGGRLSSVMSISTKDGDKNKFGATASSSFMAAKLLLEGPIPNGSFIISGRKSFSNKILDNFFDENHVPVDFYDVSMKTNFTSPDFIPGAKFTVSGMFSGDNLKQDNPRVEDYKWSNNIMGIRWLQVPDSPLFFELAFSTSQFKGELISKQSGATPKKNIVDDFSMEMNFNYVFDSKDEVVSGFHIRDITTTLAMNNAVGVPVEIKANGTSVVFFSKYKMLRFDEVDMDLGVRINAVNLSRNSSVVVMEPRLNIKIRPTDNFALIGAAGVYQQEISTVTNEYEVINIFEPWVISPEYIKPQVAAHYITGIEFVPSEDFFITVESYYKKIDNFPVVNQKKILVTDPDFVTGEAESYGVEIFNKSKLEFITLMASYTNAYTYKTLGGLRYYNKYDIRHQVNLNLDFDLGNGWNVGASWIFHSGLPYTKIIGYYDKMYIDDYFYQNSYADFRQPYTILGIDNLHRLPEYHKLDITLSKKFDLSFAKVTLDASIINVYNRKNIFYFKRENGERVNMLPFLPTATIKVKL
ncbi:MAG: TonB-dependent receptor plug [Ignavibacteria bacterium]|nr:MAG: TonB-dependent receptor plug [Ignavibacteria bacterium]KAF0161776.1 MAG: TonB-dependent receptor plug [Ignavibacteria bacterium]